jgi:hypothetical protein
MSKKNKLQKPTLAESKSVIGFAVAMLLAFLGLLYGSFHSRPVASVQDTPIKFPFISNEPQTLCHFLRRLTRHNSRSAPSVKRIPLPSKFRRRWPSNPATAIASGKVIAACSIASRACMLRAAKYASTKRA